MAPVETANKPGGNHSLIAQKTVRQGDSEAVGNGVIQAHEGDDLLVGVNTTEHHESLSADTSSEASFSESTSSEKTEL